MSRVSGLRAVLPGIQSLVQGEEGYRGYLELASNLSARSQGRNPVPHREGRRSSLTWEQHHFSFDACRGGEFAPNSRECHRLGEDIASDVHHRRAQLSSDDAPCRTSAKRVAQDASLFIELRFRHSLTCCSINNPNRGGCMHSSMVQPDRRGEATPANGTGRACPGSVVVERGRTGTCARAGRSTPRRPGAAMGDVPALTGGGGSRLARVLARPCPLGP